MVSQRVPSWNQLRECLLGLNAVLEAEDGVRGGALHRGSKGRGAREAPSLKEKEPSAKNDSSETNSPTGRSATA